MENREGAEEPKQIGTDIAKEWLGFGILPYQIVVSYIEEHPRTPTGYRQPAVTRRLQQDAQRRSK
jgi:hypothetical protein